MIALPTVRGMRFYWYGFKTICESRPESVKIDKVILMPAIPPARPSVGNALRAPPSAQAVRRASAAKLVPLRVVGIDGIRHSVTAPMVELHRLNDGLAGNATRPGRAMLAASEQLLLSIDKNDGAKAAPWRTETMAALDALAKAHRGLAAPKLAGSGIALKRG